MTTLGTAQDQSHGSCNSAADLQKYVKPMYKNQIQMSNIFKDIFFLPSLWTYTLFKLPVVKVGTEDQST